MARTAKKDRLNIWILEDDPGCQFVYEQILKNEFNLMCFDNIKEFREAIDDPEKTKPVLIIADLMLTDGNFLNFISNGMSKGLGDEYPFIIVSSNDDVEALRTCFKEGACDYITKPFKKNELMVKIENILQGQRSLGKKLKPRVRIDGIEIKELTSKQIKLLNLFLENESRRVERCQILDEIWGRTSVHPKTIDVHLYNLRRKLHPYGYIIKSEGQGIWSLMSDRKAH